MAILFITLMKYAMRYSVISKVASIMGQVEIICASYKCPVLPLGSNWPNKCSQSHRCPGIQWAGNNHLEIRWKWSIRISPCAKWPNIWRSLGKLSLRYFSVLMDFFGRRAVGFVGASDWIWRNVWIMSLMMAVRGRRDSQALGEEEGGWRGEVDGAHSMWWFRWLSERKLDSFVCSSFSSASKWSLKQIIELVGMDCGWARTRRLLLITARKLRSHYVVIFPSERGLFFGGGRGFPWMHLGRLG